MTISTATYVMLLLPVLASGGAMSRMMIELMRREASRRRVERALVAFWLSLAILLSVHGAHALNALTVRF